MASVHSINTSYQDVGSIIDGIGPLHISYQDNGSNNKRGRYEMTTMKRKVDAATTVTRGTSSWPCFVLSHVLEDEYIPYSICIHRCVCRVQYVASSLLSGRRGRRALHQEGWLWEGRTSLHRVQLGAQLGFLSRQTREAQMINRGYFFMRNWLLVSVMCEHFLHMIVHSVRKMFWHTFYTSAWRLVILPSYVILRR